jgi:FkbM family methyltransferase
VVDLRQFSFLNVLPVELRAAAYHRFYQHQLSEWRARFDEAPLLFAPSVRMDLCSTDVAHGEIALAGFYELGLTRSVVRAAREGGLMVDVGANYGYFSLLWASAGAANRVVAFEPSPRVITALRHNVALNQFAPQIDVRSAAAGQAAGTQWFTLGSTDQTGWGGLLLTPAPDAVPVEVVRLDQALDATQPIAFLKIDAEGADTWVLYGAEGLLARRLVRRIHFERNLPRMRALGISEHEAVEFLRGLGFRVRTRGSPGSEVTNVEAWAAGPTHQS